MAVYCSHCGTELEGRFCAKCGAPAPGAPGPNAPPPPSQPVTPLAMPGLDENVASALAYLIPVLSGVLLLFIEPYNRNKTVRFHALQAIFFWIGVFIADAIVDTIFGGILGGANSYELFRLIATLFRLAVLILWLALMFRAYNKQRWMLPVVGEMAQKFV